MEVNEMKKLSEYEALEGLKVLGQITRAIAPFAKSKDFMAKLRACFSQANESDIPGSGVTIFIDFIDLVTTNAPELLIELVAIMSGKNKKAMSKEKLLDIADDAMEIFNDEKLVSFLSKRFSLGASAQPSTSMTVGDNA